jgi:site-specific recombinase XerD
MKTRKLPPAPWNDAVASYLEQLGLRKSHHTASNYKGDLADFAAWYDRVNDPPLAHVGDVTSVDLAAWQRDIEHRPGRLFKDGRPQGRTMPATINRKLTALHSFLKWAAAQGLVPGAAERPDMRARQELAPKWLDGKEEHRLRKALELKRDKMHQALIYFALATGLRCAELAALQWSDIRISERKGAAVIRRGKGAKFREVPLGKEARDALELIGSPALLGTDGPVFLSRGRPLSERGVRFIVETYGKLANLPDLTAHVLRHTFAHNFLSEPGNTLEKLARILGHNDINTTKIYVTSSLQELQDSVENMGRRRA